MTLDEKLCRQQPLPIPADGQVDVRRPEDADQGVRDRLDGAEIVIAVLVAQRAPAAAEVGIDRSQIGVLLVAIAAGGIGLPDFDQRVSNRRAGAVIDMPFHHDALPARLRLRQHMGKITLENIKAGGMRRQTDVHIRPGGLRGRFRQILFHHAAPCVRFSNHVARWPRSTRSKR